MEDVEQVVQKRKPWKIGEVVKYRGRVWSVYDYPAETFVDRRLVGKVCLIRTDECRRHHGKDPDCCDCVQGVVRQVIVPFWKVEKQ